MKILTCGAAVLLTSIAQLTFALEPLPLPRNQISVELASPPLDGTVSIGVFNATNQCVRVLFKSEDQEKIPAALNGFSIVWDGKTDSGKSAIQGQYEIRGVTVGDVRVEGEAYHFNDWIDPEKPDFSPISTQFVRWIPGKSDGSFIAFQTLANGFNQLARYDAKGQRQWSATTRFQPIDLTIANGKICLASADYLQQFDLEKGTLSEPNKSLANIRSLASNSDEIFAAVNNQLVRLDRANLEPTKIADLPPQISMLVASEKTFLASDGTNIFQLTNGTFEKLNLPPMKIQNLARGKAGAFWVIADNTLTEFNFSGEPQRYLEREGEDAFLTFDVTGDDSGIAIVSTRADRQRFRTLRWTETPTKELSLWKTLLQKDTQPSTDFGIDSATTKLVPKGALPPERSLSVALVENPLTPGQKASLRVRSNSIENQLWLTTDDGLPLVLIADSPATRMALVRGRKSGSLTFYAAVPGSVAEFSIDGLQNMMQFSSDKIQWPPGPRQAPDESNIPNNAPAPAPE